MNIHEFRRMIDDIDDALPDYCDKVVTVRLSEPSIDATASVNVSGIITGFDWDSWQIMINTDKPVIRKCNE